MFAYKFSWYLYLDHCRLRQCCCHLSLLTSALHRKESEQDQDDLDLELAMGALSLDDRTMPGANGGEEGNNYQDGMPVSSHFSMPWQSKPHNKLFL